VIVKGRRGDKKVTYTADMVGRMAPGTGLPASIAALMMDDGHVTVKGRGGTGRLHRPGYLFEDFPGPGGKDPPEREDRIHVYTGQIKAYLVQRRYDHRSDVMKETPRLNIAKSLELFEQACTLVPGGVLGARKPTDFINGEYPIFLESGKGCRLTDVDGNEFVDFLCGYGPIILGYREEEVDRAVYDQISGKGFCFTLTQKFQNRLAEKDPRTGALCGDEHFFENRVRRHHRQHPHRPGPHRQTQGDAVRVPRLA
jgi:hypothetical protein